MGSLTDTKVAETLVYTVVQDTSEYPIKEDYLTIIFPGDTLLTNNNTEMLKLAWLGSLPEISSGKIKGQNRHPI